MVTSLFALYKWSVQNKVLIGLGWAKSYQVENKGDKINYWWEGELSGYLCN